MRVAVLGGSRFVGFHAALALVRAGASVTLLNRGRTVPPAPIAGAAHVSGDRDDPRHPSRLTGTFDAVFDFSGHHPRHVMPFLAPEERDRVGHYIFCSTSSVYRVPPPCPHDESAPRRHARATYGGDKARAEDVLLDAGRRHRWPVTVLRPQGIIGVLEPRAAGFVFARLHHGLPLFLGPHAGRRINLLDVDDFAAALLRIAASSVSHGRAYNVAGPDAVSALELVRLCGEVSGRDVRVSAPADWRHHFVEIGPPWLGHDLIANTSAIQHDLGVEFRPLRATLTGIWSALLERPGALTPQLLPAERCLQAARRVPLRMVAAGLRRAAGRLIRGS